MFRAILLYVEAPAMDRALLRSPDVPKALRIEITYKTTCAAGSRSTGGRS